MDAKASPSPDQVAEHRSWRRWAIGSTVGFLLALTPIVGLHLYDAYLVAEANRRIAELDRTEPGWRDTKSKRDPLPADRDSIVVMRRVMALLPKKWSSDIDYDADSDLEVSPPPCMLANRDVEELETALHRVSAALAVARTLKDFPDGWLEVIPSKDNMTPAADDVQQARTISQLLQYSVRDSIQRGDLPAAWEACRAQLNLGKPLQEGELMVMLNRTALPGMAIDSIERILAHGEIPEADLALVQKSLSEEADLDFYFPFLPHDCAFVIRFSDDMLANRIDVDKQLKMAAALRGMFRFGEKEEDIGWWGKLNERYPRFMLLKSRLGSLERMAAVYRLNSLKGFARYEAFERLEREFGPSAPDRTQQMMWDIGTQRKLLGAERRILARLGCAEVALAAERYRMKFGHWPANVTELVDKGLLRHVADDPFDGKSLRLRLPADGIVVYAVGDKKDYDGTFYDTFGHVRDDERPTSEFRLWNPDRRRQPPIPPRKKFDED